MICVMLRCNIMPQFRARCPDMDPFPNGSPRLPDVKASLLNLPGLNGPGNFFPASTAAAGDSAGAYVPRSECWATAWSATLPVISCRWSNFQ